MPTKIFGPSVDERVEKALNERLGSREKGSYVAASRIAQLETIQHPDFDLTKLLNLCRELESAWRHDAHYSVVFLVRAIIDHVPPIFGCNKFTEVVSNYSGGKSFKDSMNHLGASSRKIADNHLHTQIRKSEALPNSVQVDFSRDLDVLLAEIVRELR